MLAGALATAGHGAHCAPPVMLVGAVAPGSTAPAAERACAAEALNDTDLWGLLRGQVAGLAPPPSLVKCIGATIAGSMFALMGMLMEGRRSKREHLVHREELGKLIPKRPSVKESEGGTAGAATAAGRAGSQAARPGSPGLRSPGSPGRGSSLSGPGSSTASRGPALLSRDSRRLSEVERAERQIKSILNKLTRERFSTLYNQLLDCCVGAEARADVVDIVAREVFAKATTQHGFVELYADLCAKLHADLHQGSVEVNFKRALLDQCQQSFTLHLEPPRIDECLDYEEQYEELVKYKTKMLGNVRLIGHLLRLRMLSPKIIFHCTDELLNIGSSEALETLCAFLQTLGAVFDTPEWQGRRRLDEVFARAEFLAEDRRRPARIRCLLKDLLDKRRNHWREWPTRASGDPVPEHEARSRCGASPCATGGGGGGGEARSARRSAPALVSTASPGGCRSRANSGCAMGVRGLTTGMSTSCGHEAPNEALRLR